MSKNTDAGGVSTSLLALILAFFVGIAAGLAVYTFVFAKGYSYLSSDPNVCINCHIMEEQYDGWKAGPHRHTAVCSDCHLPHDNIVNKYYVKGENGFWHGLKFTTGDYPENIVARQVSLDIVNESCLHCHAQITDDIRHPITAEEGEVFDCIRCHRDIGH